MCQNYKINICSCSNINCSTGQSFEPGKLNLTGKCVLPVAKSGIKKKKKCGIKVFQTFIECCIQYKLLCENLNAIAIIVRV